MRRNTVRAAAILGTLALTALAAACSGQSATEQNAGNGGGGGGKVTISHWQHQSDARAKLVQGFVDSYKDANIDFQSIPYESYFQKLGAALEAGNGPCVFQLPANILAEFYGRGELAPVPDSIMSTEEIESAFTPASIKLLKIEGKYYALPTDVQTLMLFYNDDLFKEAGLDPTQSFATWDDLVDAAKKLTKTSGGKMTQAGIDIAASPYQWFYAAPTLAYPDGLVNDETGDVDYDSDPGYQAWQRITSLVTEDHVDDPEFLAEQSKFTIGKAAMTFKEFTFVGVYGLASDDLHFSVHPAPPFTDDQAAQVASTSWSYAVSADCKDQEAAWKWVAYLTSEESQKKWIEGGAELPSRTALLSDESLQEDPNIAAGFQALKNAVPYDSNGWDDAYAIQQEIWDEIVLNGTDVKTAVDKGAEDERELYRTKGLLE
jgi:multiple sugar transport system substrate-binding protein